MFDTRTCIECDTPFTAARTVGRPRLMCGSDACRRRAAVRYSRTYRERTRLAA